MRTLAAIFIAILPLAGAADVVVPVDKVETSVNIRLEPDAKSEVVGRLKQGESIPWVSSEPGWHKVQLEGDATGFISADWSVVRDEEVEEVAAEQVAEEEDVEEQLVEAESVAEEPTEEEVESAAEEPVAEVEVEETVADVVEEAVAEVEEVVDEATPEAVEEAVEAAELIEPVEATAVSETVVVTGPPGPAGPPGAATIKGSENYVVKFKRATEGGNSQIYDNGNQVGIGTTDPKQRLEVNGSIQIHEQNSSVAGLMITQSSGETGYIMHNRASTLTIGAGSQDRITIDREGNVGIAVARPTHPLEMVSGAHVSAGGVWTNSSSRQLKENISELSPEQAMSALLQLEPVLFNYRNETSEEYVGFIAEDVPDLVANGDRQSLSAMDIVAVLTKVVQQQQRQIENLEARLDQQ